MKVFKKLIPILLVVVLCFSLTIPTFAASGSVAAVMGVYFPAQSTSSYSSGYTRVIQRLMYVYSQDTRDIISACGGIDGVFGNGTKNAVVKFQAARGFSQDGQFGQQSWPWLGNNLSYTRTLTFNNGLMCRQYSYNGYVMVALGNMTSSGSVQSSTTSSTVWYGYSINGLTNSNYDYLSSFTLFRIES